jgi:prevent-host-death family protein
MVVIDIHEAQKNLSKLLKRVAAGEEIVIAKFGNPVARLFPFEASTQPKRKPGSLKGKIKILPGFDEMDKGIGKLFSR